MKRTVTVLLALVPLFSFADSDKFVNADGTKESSICIDAVKSNMNLLAISKKYNASKGKLKTITCNGLVLEDFVARHRGEDKSKDEVKVFSFSNENNNVEAELCIAAANSNVKLKEAMTKFNKPKSFVENISCNGIPLEKFAKKYGNKSISI